MDYSNRFGVKARVNSTRQTLYRHARIMLGVAATTCLISSAFGGLNPPPDGGYPGQNTATGTLAMDNMPASGYGQNNTAIGYSALVNNSSGTSNAALGANALRSNTTGGGNTANGMASLYSNTIGSLNTGSGFQALYYNTTGYDNVAHGVSSLYSNTTGHHNSANGWSTLLLNTSGNENTASGSAALLSNTGGSDNAALGFRALYSNTTGNYNLANGANALYSNKTGFYNTANGSSALFRNITGSYNTADGLNALYGNTSGGNNIALGFSAGSNLTTGSNNIDIGNRGVAGEAGGIRIGTKGTQLRTFIAGISGVAVAGGVGVVVDTNGQLGTVMSSARFKEQIKPMNDASESLLALRPVTFHYKHDIDPEGINQFGLIAEEVEKVNPNLVARDERGKPYTVRYEAVNAMLLNEFLKEHRKVAEQALKQQELETLVTQQQKAIESLTSTLKEQATQIQKVSAQMAVQQSVTRTVADK